MTVRELIAEQIGMDVDYVTPEKELVDDLGCDSLDAVELLIDAEDLFEIDISDEDASKLVTVGDAESLIERLRVGK